MEQHIGFEPMLSRWQRPILTYCINAALPFFQSSLKSLSTRRVFPYPSCTILNGITINKASGSIRRIFSLTILLLSFMSEGNFIKLVAWTGLEPAITCLKDKRLIPICLPCHAGTASLCQSVSFQLCHYLSYT